MAQIAVLLDPDEQMSPHWLGWLEPRAWVCHVARSEEEAWRLCEGHLPQVLLTVTRSEIGAHFDFFYRIRRKLPGRIQPVIVAKTSADAGIDRARALDSGADIVLVDMEPPDDFAVQLEEAIKRASENSGMVVRFWGVRGSIPAPGPQTVRTGGNTSCVELRAEGELMILDAGTGIRPLGLRLQEEFGGQKLDATLLITHTHWDHIQGFPFFAPAYRPGNHLRILGYEGSKRGLEGTLSGQMESTYFPVSLRQIPSHLEFREMKELSFQIGRVAVEAAFAHHPGITMGYRLRTPAGTVVYLPDHEVYSRESILKMAQFQQAGEAAELADHAREQDEKIAQFIRGADLLIMDSQYLAEEYPSHVGWGHSCVDDVVETAVAGGVKRLRLFHHDPAHNDDTLDQKLEAARTVAQAMQSDLDIDLAREGDTLTLG